MNKWEGNVALVTGASAGIGATTVINFAKAGIITIGMARRPERVDELKKSVKPEIAENIHSIKGDVSDEASVKTVFNWINDKFGGVNILVNNAGINRSRMILDEKESADDFRDIINTNLLGLMYCTREAYKQLKESGDYGYILNINSTVGHRVPIIKGYPPMLNMYPPSKYAVTALSEVIRQEISYLENKKVRITSISPGMTQSDFMTAAGMGDNFDWSHINHLKSEDISQAIIYVLSTPHHVQVKELTIQPVGEQF